MVDHAVSEHSWGETPLSYQEPKEATDEALAGLHFSAFDPSFLGEAFPNALAWWLALARQGVRVPLFLVLDLGRLVLEGERFRCRALLGVWFPMGERERVARQLYEERVLFRRFNEPCFYRAADILHNLSPALRDQALVLLLQRLLASLSQRLRPSRLLYPDLSLALPTQEEVLAARRRLEQARRDPLWLLRQVEMIHQWAAEHLDLERLLREEDFYELEHIALFPAESLRVMARNVKRLERALPPPRLAPRFHRRLGLPQQSLARAMGEYPAGGFAELSNRGSLESLLPSELLYWEPEEQVDLFRLRWVEDQLLFYQRDESSLKLMRRTFHFLLLEQDLRINLPFWEGGPKVWNVLRALLLRLVEDLSQLLEQDDVRFRATLVGEQADEPTLEILRLFLREKIEQGRVRLDAHQEPFDLQPWVEAQREPDRRVTLIIMGAHHRLAERKVTATELTPLLQCVLVPVLLSSPEFPGEPEAGVIPLPLHQSAAPGVILGQVRDAILQQVV